ncbi:MAG: hypothetical protein U9P80_09570 [Thermodesulfobacteriota bacterium]|nr:hypothetical protein [Thermodesulfobacteriota bacterium]
MNPCERCPIDDKIYECCGRFPDSGETAYLELDDSRRVTACPYLDRHGRCTIYEKRPLGCQTYYCSHFLVQGKALEEYLGILSCWGIIEADD